MTDDPGNDSVEPARSRPVDGRSAAEVVADPVTPAGTSPGVDGTEGDEGKKKRGFPSPLGVLVLVLLGVWALTLVLPSGQYQRCTAPTGATSTRSPPT